MTRFEACPPLWTAIVAGLVIAACGGDATAPDGTTYPELPDLSGAWTASLSDGRFFDHGSGEWSEGACAIEALPITLHQGAAAFVSSNRRAATLTGSHETVEMVCTGVSDAPLPDPFGDDTVRVLTQAALEGTLEEQCLDPAGWTGLSGCNAPLEPVLELKLPDVAPASSAGVHYNLWLRALRPTASSMVGHFELRAFESIEPDGASSTLIMEGSLRATR